MSRLGCPHLCYIVPVMHEREFFSPLRDLPVRELRMICDTKRVISCAARILGLAIFFLGVYAMAEPAPAADHRIFEMRTYTTNEGKLDDLHARFRDHTNRIFVKHGITLIGYWTPVEGPESKNTLVYILAYPSREARERAWQAFRNDPEWQKAKADSEKNGVLVKNVDSKFLRATDYSPIQ